MRFLATEWRLLLFTAGCGLLVMLCAAALAALVAFAIGSSPQFVLAAMGVPVVYLVGALGVTGFRHGLETLLGR